jgi:hypothetical protein
MITLTEFINKYKGKWVDFDGYYGAQCVDLVQYWSQNLGGHRFKGDAYSIFYQAGTFYDQVPNPPIGNPKEGDIVVWAYTYNWAGGHTGVATGKGISTGASSDWFECFEQNDPTGKPCQLKNYNFNNVLGWLHPKNYEGILTCDQKVVQIKNWINDGSIPDSDFRYKVKNLLS